MATSSSRWVYCVVKHVKHDIECDVQFDGVQIITHHPRFSNDSHNEMKITHHIVNEGCFLYCRPKLIISWPRCGLNAAE